MANFVSVLPQSSYSNKITQDGVDFIRQICTVGGQNLLNGKNSYPLPYTNPSINKVWSCNITNPFDNNKIIKTSTDLIDALIFWFNKYAEMYGLDANVIAAQAYVESNYKMWNYAGSSSINGSQSTASGINQFTMLTIYDVVVANNYETIKMTPDEISKIIINLKDSNNKDSYNVASKTSTNAWHNRPILHQNVINNPDVMIKAQCRYLKHIANKCNSLTSTTLFGYSRGPGYALKTYTDSIQTCANNTKNNPNYLKEGVDYVFKIFNILGNKNNNIKYYFGYDDKMGNTSKNLKLNQSFDSFNANLA